MNCLGLGNVSDPAAGTKLTSLHKIDSKQSFKVVVIVVVVVNINTGYKTFMQ